MMVPRQLHHYKLEFKLLIGIYPDGVDQGHALKSSLRQDGETASGDCALLSILASPGVRDINESTTPG
jgi:hypothetical protein